MSRSRCGTWPAGSATTIWAPDDRRLLLAGYLGRQPDAAEAERLERLAWLYDYVCLLWSEALRDAAAGRARRRPMRPRATAGAAPGMPSPVVAPGKFRHTSASCDAPLPGIR